jgi:hypothetical protein
LGGGGEEEAEPPPPQEQHRITLKSRIIPKQADEQDPLRFSFFVRKNNGTKRNGSPEAAVPGNVSVNTTVIW